MRILDGLITLILALGGVIFMWLFVAFGFGGLFGVRTSPGVFDYMNLVIGLGMLVAAYGVRPSRSIRRLVIVAVMAVILGVYVYTTHSIISYVYFPAMGAALLLSMLRRAMTR